MDSSCLTLDPSLIQKFKLSKVFRDNSKHINSIEFDHTGEVCITSAEDETINIYDAISGKYAYFYKSRHKKTIPSKKYGASLAKFAHRQNNIIYASTKGEDAIRYLSLHDYKFIRYFHGHKNKVVSLEMSPGDDKFLSGSIDDTVRLWDLRSPNCQGIMNIIGHPCVAFDPSGVLFGVALNSRYIRLYDLRNYEKGPFSTFDIVERNRNSVEWTNISFSNDGKDILISTKQDVHYLVDSFDGFIKNVFRGHLNNAQIELKASFTPDSKFVFSGSQSGQIHVWEKSGKRVSVFEGHTNGVSNVMFNPKYCMFASACTNLVTAILNIGILDS